MRILLSRSFNSRTQCYKYESLESDTDIYMGYAKRNSLYSKPFYIVKYKNIEVCRFEDDNMFRRWLVLISILIPRLRAKYILKMEGLRDNCVLKSNGRFFSIIIDRNTYLIKGHSKCVVTIWENDIQVGIIKRNDICLGNGFETIEILYESHIPTILIILFSIFGWEKYVGTVNANRTQTTIFLNEEKYDANWKPKA